jgi:hypothetical protein
MRKEDFYGKLGGLLYAIADCDQRISRAEKETLFTLISELFLPEIHEKDAFGTPIAFYPEFAFTFAENEVVDPEQEFTSFVDFIDRHSPAITRQMIEHARKSVLRMASVYYGISRKENELIAKVNQSLEHLLNSRHRLKTTSS